MSARKARPTRRARGTVTSGARRPSGRAQSSGRALERPGPASSTKPGSPRVQRSGFGFDIHPLVPGRPLVLGGVTVPSELGLGGHSDADVLSHAIGEALLGALALGDL